MDNLNNKENDYDFTAGKIETVWYKLTRISEAGRRGVAGSQA